MSDADQGIAKRRGRGKVSCPRCQSASPVGDHFCRRCGYQLDDSSETIVAQVTRQIPDQIDTALVARFRDQKVVEVEIAQRLAERAMTWLKLVGFFAGIPLLVCGVALSLFGFKTYSDLQSAVQKAAVLEGIATGAEKQMEAAKKRVDQIDTALKTAQARIDEHLIQLDRQQQSLQMQVRNIQARLSFCPNKRPSVEQQNKIKEELAKYILYLEDIGFNRLVDQISICIFSKEDPIKGSEEPAWDSINAFYDGRTVYIHKDIAAFPEVALKEYTQHALLSAAPKRSPQDVAVELIEGLADYFTRSYYGTPLVSDGVGTVLKIDRSYLRDLSNDRKYPTDDDDPHSKGEVWAGALWLCRGKLGRGVLDKAVLAAWSEFNDTDRAPEVRRFTPLLEKHERALRGRTMAGCLAQETTKRGLPR
jgi:ribosomal protein L40E